MNIRILTGAVLASLTLSGTARAEEELPFKVDVSADVRLRAEQDWDSQTGAGVKRNDRARLRVRARANAVLDFGEGLKVFGRLRSGGVGSQQNANITFHDFDGNPTDEFDVTLDRLSAQYQGKSAGVELGRMAFPFFTQNEYFWDGDINPLGVAGNVSLPVGGKAKLKLVAGAFKPPVSLSRYSGALYAAQGVVTAGPVIVAGGVFRFDADSTDADRLRLLDANGSRDYTVLALNGQVKIPAGGRSLTLGADYYHNAQGYAASPDPISRANDGQRDGYVLSVAWGDTAKPGNFQIGYRWSHIEKLAVNASYAHDDLARFGTAAQAALTDLEAHDLYANYALTKRITLGLRAMFVDRITTIESGKRARFDISYAF